MSRLTPSTLISGPGLLGLIPPGQPPVSSRLPGARFLSRMTARLAEWMTRAMANGYIKLHRQLASHPLWLAEPFTRGQAWADMLLNASHRSHYVRIRGVRVDLQPGQLALSEVAYAERWQWSRGKVRRFLNELETVQQIVQQKTNVTTVITVSNWTEYQGNGTADGTASDTANGQQTDTYKNVKKGKKEEQQRAPAPPPVDDSDPFAALTSPAFTVPWHHTITGADPSPAWLTRYRTALGELKARNADATEIRAAFEWYANTASRYKPRWPEDRFFNAEWITSLAARHKTATTDSLTTTDHTECEIRVEDYRTTPPPPEHVWTPDDMHPAFKAYLAQQEAAGKS